MHVRIISAGHPRKPEENIVKKSPHLNYHAGTGSKEMQYIPGGLLVARDLQFGIFSISKRSFLAQLYLQLIQLLLFNSRRSIKHHITSGIVFWKGNKITNALAASKDRTKAVKPKGNTSMRRCSIFKSSKQKAKFMTRFFIAHTKSSKHFFLQFSLKDPD
jgi:hypothetical protein